MSFLYKIFGVTPGSGVDDMGFGIGMSLLGGCLVATCIMGGVIGFLAWCIHHFLHWF